MRCAAGGATTTCSPTCSAPACEPKGPARSLLAQHRPAQALTLLDKLLESAAGQDRAGSVVEIQALQGLALAAAGDEPAAVDALARALTATSAVAVAGEPPFGIRAKNVHFTPGSRSAWHAHPFGQVLHVTAGTGRVQRKGGAITEFRAGDTVHAEPGEVHWHDAAPDSFMTHLATQNDGPDGTGTQWLDHVTDEEYHGNAITREHLLTGDPAGRPGRIDRVENHQVTLPPGQAAGPHTHPGGVVGYVTSGQIVFEPDGHPAQELRAGSAPSSSRPARPSAGSATYRPASRPRSSPATWSPVTSH